MRLVGAGRLLAGIPEHCVIACELDQHPGLERSSGVGLPYCAMSSNIPSALSRSVSVAVRGTLYFSTCLKKITLILGPPGGRKMRQLFFGRARGRRLLN